MNLTEFLAARLAEDEAVARAANVKQDDPEWHCSPVLAARAMGRHGATTVRSVRDSRPMARVESCSGDEGAADITDGDAVAAHIARHGPARALREVAAKRRILVFVASIPQPEVSGPVLGWMAEIYSSHPDYRAEWAPQ